VSQWVTGEVGEGAGGVNLLKIHQCLFNTT
jgi:hypothetical protein